MERKQEYKMNVGGSSIILIIVVFALSIFAVLSIKASNSDLVLAKKTRATMDQYYAADGKAEERLSEISQVLYDNDTVASLETSLKEVSEELIHKSSSNTQGTIGYSIPINDYASLQVELTYDLENPDAIVDITTWKVNQEDIGEYDFSDFQFWDGTLEEE